MDSLAPRAKAKRDGAWLEIDVRSPTGFSSVRRRPK